MSIRPYERPILFSAPMIQAILENRKTQTRRTIKPQPFMEGGQLLHHKKGSVWESGKPYDCPYGRSGDRLWVRETWKAYNESDTGYCSIKYRAGGDMEITSEVKIDNPPMPTDCWRPSIFMPRWASRILLEITSTKAERLQDISEEDAIAEGLEDARPRGCEHLIKNWRGSKELPSSIMPTGAFRYLWESINGNGSWEANPWVWVVKFRRLHVQ